MIPPQDKAMELILRYYELIPMNTISFAKKCALIAVDEILNVIHTNIEDKYWQEVKQEIKKL
jgi:hypothetical protein